MGPLKGLRILAVEQYGAGPFGTQALADLGADIIKVENPHEGGDVTRALGPHFDDRLGTGAESLFFQAINRNKRSIALDLARPEGRAVFRDLARDADAVACNLRGDVPARLGIAYGELAAVNPRLVCAFLTAYGRTGERAAWPGYDYLVQAETGYFMLNGEPDAPPARFGLSIIDFMTGYCMALALVAGVMEARRTGRGRDVDVCLYDVGLANLSYLATWWLNAGTAPGRVARSGHPTLVPCQLFRTADGWIYVMANKEKFFPALCERLGVPQLASDPRFATFADRLAHRDLLTGLLDGALMAAPTGHWLRQLAGVVPVAPVLTMGEALAAPFTAEREMIAEVTADGGATLRLIGSPFRGWEEGAGRAAPPLGRDSAAVLREAGYSPAEIDRLGALGILR